MKPPEPGVQSQLELYPYSINEELTFALAPPSRPVLVLDVVRLYWN